MQTPNFVRFSCGCVGFEPDETGWSLVVKPCDVDSHDDPISLGMRDMSGKNGAWTTDLGESHRSLFSQLSTLVHDGHRWQQLKRDLRS